MSKLRVRIPTLDEQRRIADVLEAETAAIDAVMQEKGRTLQLLEEWGRSEISTVLDSCSEQWMPFKYVLARTMSYGANEAADQSNPHEPRFIRITDIRPDGTLRPDTYRSLPAELARPYLLVSGDLLFARSGATVGKTFLYDTDRHDNPACFAGYLIRARLDPHKVLPRFAYYWAQTHRYWDEVGLALIQATIQNVSAERYANLPFPRASLEAQQQAVQRLDASAETVAGLRARLTEQLGLLKERRQALITAAVTGQLDLSSHREPAATA